MSKIIAKIVLTGGPCAGKTSALSKIEEDLTEKGYKVFIVPESATELINGGIKCFGDNSLNVVKFQELILRYQMDKEKLYEDAASSLEDGIKSVIIFDRGVIDNKAYLNQDIFDAMLDRFHLKELDLMDNYNMVIHLVSAADGAKNAYTLSNNKARSESIDEAINLDLKTVNAWAGHHNLRIIDNSTNFETKMQRVLDEINNLIGAPVSKRTQRKYLIDLSKSDLSFLNKNNMAEIGIEQSYIEIDRDYEIRLRKRTYNGDSSYYLTEQLKKDEGRQNIFKNNRISKEEYLKLMANKHHTVSKKRYAFTYNKQYFRLDDFDGFAVLELDLTVENEEVIIPDSIKVIKEITNNKEFNNYNLAKNIEKIKKYLKKGC